MADDDYRLHARVIGPPSPCHSRNLNVLFRVLRTTFHPLSLFLSPSPSIDSVLFRRRTKTQTRNLRKVDALTHPDALLK